MSLIFYKPVFKLGSLLNLLEKTNNRRIMVIELPVIKEGLVIGEFNTSTGSISQNKAFPMQFQCFMISTCCQTIKIPVTDFDIDRIEKRGYAIDQIIEVFSPILRLPKTKYGSIEKNYWIKRKPYDNSCTFLEGDICSIHVFKPFCCQIFPFSLKMLDSDRILVKIHPSNLCKSIRVVEHCQMQNKKIMEELMEAVQAEFKVRIAYFSNHSDQI